jgi:DnaK suppressor protein
LTSSPEPGPAPHRERLLAARRQVDAEIGQLEREHERLLAASESSNADDEHDPEGATIAFEREQLHATVARLRHTRADLAAALTDLDHGNYGICTVCGRPIAPERLEARPHTRTCIDCARARPQR